MCIEANRLRVRLYRNYYISILSVIKMYLDPRSILYSKDVLFEPLYERCFSYPTYYANLVKTAPTGSKLRRLVRNCAD